jgi:hypothetical protein
MPTVLRARGFSFQILTRDHPPPHVHAFKAGRRAKINIGDAKHRPELVWTDWREIYA